MCCIFSCLAWDQSLGGTLTQGTPVSRFSNMVGYCWNHCLDFHDWCQSQLKSVLTGSMKGLFTWLPVLSCAQFNTGTNVLIWHVWGVILCWKVVSQVVKTCFSMEFELSHKLIDLYFGKCEQAQQSCWTLHSIGRYTMAARKPIVWIDLFNLSHKLVDLYSECEVYVTKCILFDNIWCRLLANAVKLLENCCGLWDQWMDQSVIQCIYEYLCIDSVVKNYNCLFSVLYCHCIIEIILWWIVFMWKIFEFCDEDVRLAVCANGLNVF